MPSSPPFSLRGEKYHAEESGQEEEKRNMERTREPDTESRRKAELTRKMCVMHMRKVGSSTKVV